MVGVVTNSDDRVPPILSSLGLSVGARMLPVSEQLSQDNMQFQPAQSEGIADTTPVVLSAPRYLDPSTRIDEDIRFVVLSYDAGAEKPDPRIFQAAKDMLKLTLQGEDGSCPDITLNSRGRIAASEIKESADGFTLLHIGDDVQKDVVGAQKAGFHGILLDREGTYSQAFEESGTKILSVPLSDRDPSTSHEMQVIQDLRDLRYWSPIQR